MKTLFKKHLRESVVNYRTAIPGSVALAMKGILTKICAARRLRYTLIRVKMCSIIRYIKLFSAALKVTKTSKKKQCLLY